MTEEQKDPYGDLDRELADLGALWRAENPGPVPVSVSVSVSGRLPLRSAAPRRRAWIVPTALVAAAVLVAVVVGVFLRPGGHDAGPATTAPLIDRLDCAPTRPHPVTGEPVVPSGPVAVRLCGRAPDPSGFEAAWPADTLTGVDAARVADAINGLEPVPLRHPCFMTTPFELVLRYADGRRVSAEGTECNGLVVGDASWMKPAAVSDLVVRLIDRQRDAAGPRSSAIPAQCPLKWQHLAATLGARQVGPNDDVAVTACQYRLDDRTTTNATGSLDFQTIPRDPSALLGDALAGTQIGCGRLDTTLARVQRVLIVRDAYGDIHVVSADPCRTSTLAGRSQYPSHAFAAALADLFAVRN